MKKNKSNKNRKKAEAGRRKELARLLSQVMKHPLLPASIYNDLGDAITNTMSLDADSPEMIEQYLLGHALDEAREDRNIGGLLSETFPLIQTVH